MNYFKFWRVTMGYRQCDVERLVGIKKWRLGLFELGHAVLSPDELVRLESVTGVTADDLLLPVQTDVQKRKTNQNGGTLNE